MNKISFLFRPVGNLSLLLMGLGLGISQNSFGTDVLTGRSAGMAGSGHAAPLLNDATFMNPSYISFLRAYSVGLNYVRYDATDSNSPFYGRHYTLAIQDGRTELFQAGAAYTNRHDGAMIHMAVARKILNPLALGLGGKFFMTSSSNARSFWDLNFSATFIATEWLQIALMADNLIESNEARLIHNEREIIIGTKFNIMGIVILYLDPVFAPSRAEGEQLGYRASAELTLFKEFFFRIGRFEKMIIPYYSDLASGLTFGAGWVAPRLSLDYGLSRVLEPLRGLPQSVTHTISATVYF